MQAQSPVRHFLDLDGFDRAVLRRMLDEAHAMKRAGRGPDSLYAGAARGKTLLMIFERPSMRTRVSFDLAMRQLGGEAVFLSDRELMLGERESVADTARVLSRYGDAIMFRTVEHARLTEFAALASVPVINGLTNRSHPCQILADLMTVEESFGPIETCTAAWVGDSNNVANSWIHAAVRLGFKLRLACPPSLPPDPQLMQWVAAEKGRVEVLHDPVAAVKDACCVVTDTWVSIGDKDVDRRKRLLAPYRVDGKLMAAAAPGAVFLHCLPAYRGNEVTAEVIDGPASKVFDEAENRLHAQKAVLAWCLGTG